MRGGEPPGAVVGERVELVQAEVGQRQSPHQVARGPVPDRQVERELPRADEAVPDEPGGEVEVALLLLLPDDLAAGVVAESAGDEGGGVPVLEGRPARAAACAAHGELVRAGVTTSEPVWLEMGPEVPVAGLWAVFFRDPDGMELEVCCSAD